jgi:hypothetical protein
LNADLGQVGVNADLDHPRRLRLNEAIA